MPAAVEHLNADQQVEAVSEGIKNAADRQYPESYEQQGLSTPRAGRAARPCREKCDRDYWVVTTQADMNIMEVRPLPFASISPSRGSMAALASET